MVLKGLPRNYKTFSTVIIQREKQMTFSDFKTALRNYEESEKSCNSTDSKGNVMYAAKPKFDGKCFKCEKKGHKISECWMKSEKWCTKCRNKTHNTRDCRAAKKDAAKSITEQPKNQDLDEKSFAFTLKDGQGRSTKDSKLLVDTGATSHIINDSSKFVSFDNNFNPNSHFIELADGSKANVVL